MNKKAFIGILLCTILLTGCDIGDLLQNGLDDTLSEQGVNVDLANGTVSWDTENNKDNNDSGKEAMINTKLPESWPSAVVQYPDSEVTESVAQISKGIHTLILEMKSPDEAQTVRDFYRGVLVAAGYEVKEMIANKVKAEKEGKVLTLLTERQGSETVISIELTY